MRPDPTPETCETLAVLSASLDAPLVPALIDAAPEQADRNPVAVYLASLSAGSSRRSMAQALEALAYLVRGLKVPDRAAKDPNRHPLETACPCAVSFPWHLLRAQHVAALRQVLADRLALATANRHLAALRGVLKAAWECELLDSETLHRALSKARGIKGETLPRGRALDSGELRALFEACSKDQGAAGRRDAALCAVLFGAGLRRAEAVALTLADVDFEAGEITVRRGKGRKDRLAPVANGARAAVAAWLEVRGDLEGPLFCPITRGGRLILRPMTTQALYGVLLKRAREAGVRHFSPHDLRRTFVSALLDAGADVSHVQQLAGHANVQTTMRYDRRPAAARRKTAELLHVPYVAAYSTGR